MLSLLAPILVFGLVIFVHELGHFIAAKLTGVYAPRFSIGFGPALFRFRRGETEYVLAALPLGGYVRMASRLDEETAFLEGGTEAEAAAKKEKTKDWDPDAMIPHGPKPVPEHRWFESKSLLARLFIMIAGVTMNVILTIVVLTALLYKVGRPIVPTTVVGEVAAATMPALAELRMGDTIRAVNGKPVATWNEVNRGIVESGEAVTFQTNRGTVTVPTASDSARIAVASSIGYYVPAVIDSIMAGERAAAAGMQRGDSVVAIDGTPVRLWTDLSAKVNASPEKPLRFDVIRGGQPRTLTITPKETKVPTAEGKDSITGKIGVGVRDITRREPIGIGRAITAGTRESWNMAANVAGFLKKLVVGDVSVRQLGGPIAITRASVSAARSGLEELFYLIALLSINVAVLNLLPIPILDGGQILLNIIESAKGSPFSMRTREYILRFGLAAIALLFITVMFNDTREGFAKLFGWIFR
ncbi:MAG TPA: RIP metalloprotease RseP [Gemmatimonadaceae bacterium]|nr:RIP metalloprotease RseP [Gemmatimonadaceae bacterium]